MAQRSSDYELKYSQLSAIDENLLKQIKLVFITNKFDSSDVIFITNIDDVYGFGSNRFGRLGFGHTLPVIKPTIIPELCGKCVTKVEFGQQFMIALTQLGDVFSCGKDERGMLGIDLEVNRQQTHNNIAPGFENFHQMMICSETSVKPKKILDNQTLAADNMGYNNTTPSELVIDIGCCATSTYLLTQSGNVYWFGFHINLTSKSPQLIQILRSEVMSISCGFDVLLALTNSGSVYTWGAQGSFVNPKGNYYNQSEPKVLKLKFNVKQISCGRHHCLLLSVEGNVYTYGQRNNLSFDEVYYVLQMNYQEINPIMIMWQEQFVEILAFDNTSMAMTNQKNVLIWDQNNINSPLIAKMSSFQETINVYSNSVFTYKALTINEIFIEKTALNRVMKTMAEAFNDSKYSDLKFKLKDTTDKYEYIYCHKWFVAKNCEYFEKMFANNWAENKSNEILISGFSYESYYQFIRYLYTDYIETENIDILIEMLSISDEYLDEELKAKCFHKLKPLMNIQNVSSLYSNALMYSSKDLEEYCFDFMSKNIKSVTKTKAYDNLDGNYAKLFLTRYSQLK